MTWRFIEYVSLTSCVGPFDAQWLSKRLKLRSEGILHSTGEPPPTLPIYMGQKQTMEQVRCCMLLSLYLHYVLRAPVIQFHNQIMSEDLTKRS